MHPGFREDPTFHARFEREAQIVAKLEHPHIVPIYDYSEHEGQPYLVMKFIEGRTLKNLLSERQLTLDEIVAILTPVAEALTYAHQQGVLHRDIKPSNIVIDRSGVPYLTDFGLARIAQAGESTMSHEMILGTPQYISPEQARGERNLDAGTDIYSLGIILYELVVGRVPFNADTPYATIHDHIYSPVPPPSLVNDDVPPAVERVLVKALAKRPADRYASANALLQDFIAALSESGLRALSPERGQRAEDSLARLRSELPAADMSAPPVIGIPAARPPLPPEAPPTPPDGKRVVIERSLDTSEIDFGKWGKRIEEGMKQGGGIVAEIARSIAEAVDENKKTLSDEERIRRKIKKRDEERAGFFGHLAAYLAVNMFLLIASEGSSWPILFFWGIGMFAHAMSYYNEYGGGAERRERRIQEEIERERARMGYYDAKPKREPRMRLTEDGELEEVLDDDYDDYSKPKRGRRGR
jgi:predicted Ser/Thr protein kinase